MLDDTPPMAYQAMLEDEAQEHAQQRHDRCVHADACDRARDMHSVEETHDWLRCEECDVYDSRNCPMAYSGTMRCRGLA